MKCGLNRAERREKRQYEALERQHAYDKLTTFEKLQMLDRAGHSAVKQRARIQAIMAREEAYLEEELRLKTMVKLKAATKRATAHTKKERKQ